VVHLIQTGAVVLTGSGGALVDVQVAVGALEPRHAEALVGVQPVLTDGSVLTGLRAALVHVLLAAPALEPGGTPAPRPQVGDVHAGGGVLARQLRTGGDVPLTVGPPQPRGAAAGVSVDGVDAVGADPLTWGALAPVDVLGAVEPREAVRAAAAEPVRPRLAGAVGARRRDAGVVQLVAVLARVPDGSSGAEAGVVAQVVHTGSVVAAGRRRAGVC